MKLLCKMLGGSYAYGLNTANSDSDIRGVFVNQKTEDIIGLGHFEHFSVKEKDIVYFELRRFLNLLAKTNSQVLEILFNQDWIITSIEWEKIQKHRHLLLDSEKFFKSLKGYIFAERKRANRDSEESYNKRFVQALRLCWAGRIFFIKDYYPVNVIKEDKEVGNLLLEIKTHPNSYEKICLNNLLDVEEKRLEVAFSQRHVNYNFNYKFANQLCLEIYYPLVHNLYKEYQNGLS